MNPFDLPGPQFLGFYFVVAALVYLFYRLMLRRAEAGEPPPLPLGDPYQIAYLRGGTAEATRGAALSLVDRGLLDIEENWLSVRGSPSRPRLPPIEQAILAHCSVPASADGLLRDRKVAAACETYQTSLEELRLLPDPRMRARRWQWFGIAAVTLLGIGFAKLEIALGRGRTNVAFLIVLGLAAVWAVAGAACRRRAALGDAMLNDLRRLFHELRMQAARVREGGVTSDALLLAAVFGLRALPEVDFADIKRLFARTDARGSAAGCGGGGGGCGGCGG